jgi:hypothetical protein
MFFSRLGRCSKCGAQVGLFRKDWQTGWCAACDAAHREALRKAEREHLRQLPTGGPVARFFGGAGYGAVIGFASILLAVGLLWGRLRGVPAVRTQPEAERVILVGAVLLLLASGLLWWWDKVDYPVFAAMFLGFPCGALVGGVLGVMGHFPDIDFLEQWDRD